MKRCIGPMALAIMFAYTSASAAGSSHLGFGKTKCSVFNAVQQGGGALVESIDSWTLGFLSALNQTAMATGKPDQLRKQQPDRIAGYIRSYCSDNTKSTVVQAVNSFWVQTNG